jgi:hypothetical protein
MGLLSHIVTAAIAQKWMAKDSVSKPDVNPSEA